MPPASRPEKSQRQTFAALLAFVFLTPFAFSQSVLIPPERIEQVKAEWKEKTHGRPVVVNWLYMSVRSNQDPQPGMTGEPMFRNFVASVELARKHKIPTTFMFEHQTLIDPRFREFMMREMREDPLLEPAMNMQVGQELVEKAGLKWRGERYVWDPAPSISYPSGFAPKDREKLVDLYMADFKEVFGRYPKTAGAWVVDTYTLRYLKEKYGVIASAECPDQWRTDYYTLWGAPQNSPYIVSRNNAYMPAQTLEKSMGVAMFRMTGGVEPIHHYEGGAATYPFGSMQMPSLFISAGRYAEWWLNMLAETPLSLGNTTPGTETAWINPDSIGDLQRMVAQYRDLGLIRTETLSQTAQAFLKENPLTPPGAENAMEDGSDTFAPATGWVVKQVKDFLDNAVKEQPEENARIVENLPKVMNWDVPRKATWYSSRYYRCGLLWEGDEFRLRDLYLYDEDIADSYLNEACRASDNVFMAMPVMDGMQWSSIADGKMAGIRLVALKPDGTREVLKAGKPKLDTPDNRQMTVSFPLASGGDVRITFDEDAATFELNGDAAPANWALELTWHRPARAFWKKDTPPEYGPNVDFFKISHVAPQSLTYTWSPPTTLHQPELGLPRTTYHYDVKAEAGTFSQPAARVVLITPASGKVKLNLNVKARAAGGSKTALFNGRDLSGWEGNPKLWRVENGCLVGETSPENPAPGNTFLLYRGAAVPQDFALSFQVKLTPKNPEGFANSGVQLRSVLQNPETWRVIGLQADISAIPGQFGFIYDEGGPGRGAGFGEKWLITDPMPGAQEVTRKTVAQLGNREELLARIHHRDQWNDYRIVARGPVMQVFVNGRQISQMELRSNVQPLGDILALQLHAGPPMKVEFRDFLLGPAPDAAPETGQLNAAPAWHNVALAKAGGSATASDTFDPFSASRLIDGLTATGEGNRWHSELAKPYPHWLELRFAKSEHIERLVLHPSDAATFPAKVRIEVPDAGDTWKEVATRDLKNTGTAVISLPPSDTTRLRVVLLESSSKDGDGIRYAQLSEIEALVRGATTAAAEAPAPFSLGDGDRVVLLGDTLIEREGRHGFIEERMAAAWPEAEVSFRNLGWSGDTPDGISRGWMEGDQDRFEELKRQLTDASPTVLVIGYGTASALEKEFDVDAFRDGIVRVMDTATGIWPGVRCLLLSPPQPGPAVSTPIKNRLALCTATLRQIACERGASFVSFADAALPTEDGLHWNAEGYRGAAGVLAQQLSMPPVVLDAARREVLRTSIVEKNAMRFFQWRFQNWVYLAGPRRAEQGRLTAELPQFEKPIANLERRIAALLKSGDLPVAETLPAGPGAEPLRPLPEFTVDNVDVQLYAETPLIGKPVQLTFDELGRMWVVCSSSYPQARPDALPDDRIYILEDTNRDGRAEKSTLFADRLTIPCGVEPGDGGCYVAASTELLFLKDTNGDGRADERRVLLSGFGTEDSHHLIHGTRWGPDGRLYFNQSLFIRSNIETPQGMVRAERGNVWRFDPRDTSLETVSHGWINPWSKAVDRYGNYFTADNSGEGLHFTFRDSLHVTQIAPRLCPPVGPLNEPKLCGLEILRGPAWPDDWQGRVVAGSHTGHSIRQYAMRENGAGFAATTLPDLVRTSDNAVRPVDLQLGPDGALYMADWTNPIINHGEVDFRDPRRDLTHGRIWRVSSRSCPPVPWEPLLQKSNPELCAELLSPNPWSQYHARRLLKERGREVLTEVKKWAAGHGSDEAKLEALWLHVALKVADDPVTDAALSARDGRVRAAALRAAPSLPAALKLAQDDHPRARLEAARVLGTFPSAESAAAVLAIHETPLDPHLDYALWLTIRELSQPWVAAVLHGHWSPQGREAQLNFALAAIEPSQAGAVLAYLLKDRVIPRDGSGPWLALIGKAGQVAEVQRVWSQFAESGFEAAATPLVLTALEEAARRNLRVSCPPDQLVPLFQHQSGPVREAALRLAGHWQLPALGHDILTIAADPAAPEAQRSAAFESLRLMQGGNARGGLAGLTTSATPYAIRHRAIINLASFDPATATPALLQLLRDTAPAEAGALWTQLFGSTSVTGILRNTLADADVPAAVCAEGLRLMDSLHLSDSALRSALRRKSATSEAEKRWTKSEFKELATAAVANGNVQRGKAIYERATLACTACHAIAGQGGQVGPDLANLGASAPLDYIVESILDPAAAVKEGFNATQVTTQDGQQFFAMAAAETDHDLLLRDAAGKETRIPKSTISGRKLIGTLMPAALTDSLKQTELLDLIGYLASLGRN